MAGIYLHIPFCKRRCIYCDFFSTTQNEKKKSYIAALCNEIGQRLPYLQGETIRTIYIGGGTPSQLAPKDFEQIFNSIFSHYTVDSKAEITLEANPDDLSIDYIKDLRNLPFNRLSMGIQTFNEDILQILNRRHTGIQALKAYENCRTAGFNNISIDLIYGLPGESTSIWEKDLQTATSLKPEHISAYHLIYEEGTPLWKLREEHKVQETNEELSLQFFSMLIDHLTDNGYEHYEISNFAQPEMYSRHNSSYWTGEKYLGCGPSAHSYDGESREWNVASLDKYISGINSGQRVYEKEILDSTTRYNDFIITSLRTCWGLSLKKLESQFGNQLYNYCMRLAQPYITQGKLQIIDNRLILSRKGIFISDSIMSDLLWVE